MQKRTPIEQFKCALDQQLHLVQCAPSTVLHRAKLGAYVVELWNVAAEHFIVHDYDDEGFFVYLPQRDTGVHASVVELLKHLNVKMDLQRHA